MKPTVAVLLSAYNGAAYIETQVASILNQEQVEIRLYIRDDGSTDDTLNILRRLKQQDATGRIALFQGENLGYQASFLWLLREAEPAEYYAFADQDDLWLPGKLRRATDCLQSLSNPAALYASGLQITDEALNVKSVKDISGRRTTLGSYFTRGTLAGCTFVFTEALRRLALRIRWDRATASPVDHDFLVACCGFACGQVYLDKEALILHRRHRATVTSGGSGLWKRIRVEWKIVFHRKNVQYQMAQQLLACCGEALSPGNTQFLKQVAAYKDGVRQRAALLFSKELHCGIRVADLETKCKILLGNF